MSRRLVVVTPSLKPVGGVVKVFDYVDHLVPLGFEPIICTRDDFDEDLPLFRDGRFPHIRPEAGVPYLGLSEFGLENEDWVLFSWPTDFDVIAKRLPKGYDLRRVIHLVQNVRHANPRWLQGYATRLLARPMSRIFVATPVLEVCEPYLNPHSPSTVIPEGHRWDYFERRRDDPISHPIRVAFTTWKSDVGDRAARLLEADDRFEFRAIRESAGWPELRDLYQWSDVFLSTPGREEGFYLPGLEAMAAGSIVLTPDAGGNMEYCYFDRNCLPVELESADSYAKALIRVTEMTDESVASIRNEAYRTLERHTLEAERDAVKVFVDDLESGLAGLEGELEPTVAPTPVGEIVDFLTEMLEASESHEERVVNPAAVRRGFRMPYQRRTLSRYPDFLGIGAQKAGTTWLHRSFESHPEVWVPKEKELHYFDEKFERRGSIPRPPTGDDFDAERWRRQLRRQLSGYEGADPEPEELDWDLTYFLEQPSDDWYAYLFDGRGSNQVAGELTPDYSTLDERVIRHIQEMMPAMKVIFFMRNPVERAWSQASMMIRLVEGGDTLDDADIEEALLSERTRQLTEYTEIIDRWAGVFPGEQFFLGFLEDISFHPGPLLGRLYRFLGVSDEQDRYRVLDRKVHSGDIEEIPARHAYLLAKTFMPLIDELSRRFGGYASGWAYVARSIIEAGPDGPDIPYPLWHWRPWRRWAGLPDGPEIESDSTDRLRLQSGPIG